MTKITSLKDLEAWQAGMDVAEVCYRLTRRFPQSEQYGLTMQMRRAAVSIPSNVAEGHQRKRPGYLYHLQVALGSLAELDTQSELAVRLEMLGSQDAAELRRALSRASQLIHALLRSLKE